MQVGMATNNSWLSAELAHPFPTLTVAVAEELLDVNVGPGSVIMAPVGVRDGNVEISPPVLREAGGHAKFAETEAGMLPAPVPPVCHA